MDSFYEDYTHDLRTKSLAELYREQDRLIVVVEKCKEAVHKPHRFIYMMNRKLELLNQAIDDKAKILSLQT